MARSLATIVLLMLLLATEAWAERRVALVIGNSTYTVGGLLPNPVNDADAMAALLRKLGFEVILGKNLTYEGMKQTFRNFSRASDRSDVAVVFYAGHGLEVDGRNFLIPVDARLERPGDLELEAIGLDAVLRQVTSARRLQLFILDACRDNIFLQSLRGARGLGRNAALGPADPDGNLLIAFATKDGATAEDGAGANNSPFTQGLLRHLGTPGLDIRVALGRVRDHVRSATGGQQQPFVYGNVGGDEISLAPRIETTARPGLQPQIDPADEAKQKAAEQQRIAALAIETKRQQDADALQKLQEAARLKAEAEAKRKAEEEARIAAIAEAKRRQEAEALAKAEQAARLKAEADAKRKAEEEARIAALAEAKRRQDAETLAKAEQAARLIAEADAKRREKERKLVALTEPRPGQDPAKAVAAGSARAFRDRHANGQSCPECPELVAVPKGEFLMGSTAAQIAAVTKERADMATEFKWEGPVRRVAVGSRLAVGRTHVTRGEFAAFVTATGHKVASGCFVQNNDQWRLEPARSWSAPGFEQGDQHPVVCVALADATAYARWLSQVTGHTYRLLSEAEAEYVTRATSEPTQPQRYVFGDDATGLCAYGNGADRMGAGTMGWDAQQVAACDDGFVHTAPVASFKANRWGLHDVHGNVWTWTADCWNDSHAGAPPDASARTSGDCARRVVRGGSWGNSPRELRAAARDSNELDTRSSNLGFRLTRVITP